MTDDGIRGNVVAMCYHKVLPRDPICPRCKELRADLERLSFLGEQLVDFKAGGLRKRQAEFESILAKYSPTSTTGEQ